jgi:hypothetical protein
MEPAMRTLIATAAMIFISELASAQTQRTQPSAWATLPTLPSAWATSALSPCYSSLNPTSPCYTGTRFPYYSAIPLEPLSTPPPREMLNVGQLSEQEVKGRMQAKGYDDVADLQKDQRGIWRGKTSLKDGRPAKVVLDLNGNVYSQVIPSVDIRIRVLGDEKPEK